MGGISRFIFVSVPFALTVCSLIALLVTIVPNDSRYLIKIDTENVSLSTSGLESMISKRGWGDLSSLTTSALEQDIESGKNISASDLGLADSYTLTLWNYCAEAGSSKNCSTAQFDYASKAMNMTLVNATASELGLDVPSGFTDAVKTYSTLNKWTEIVYMIAAISLAVELVFGIIALFSKVGSCCTFITSGVSSFTLIAASALATALASISVGSLDSVGKLYGLKASINTGFLASTWIAVAFSLGAGFFWMFSICCCDGANRHNRRNKNNDAEKMPTGAYQRVQEPSSGYVTGPYSGQQTGIYDAPMHQGYGASQPEYGVPTHNPKASRNTAGYEPYSHAAI